MTYDWSSYGIIVWENKLVGVRKIVNGMPGKWGPPGGKRTPSEMTALQTLLRKIHEETGLRIRGPQARPVYKTRRRGKKGNKFQVFYYIIYPTEVQMTLLHAGTSSEETSLITRTEMERTTTPLVQRVIRQHLPSGRQHRPQRNQYGGPRGGQT